MEAVRTDHVRTHRRRIRQIELRRRRVGRQERREDPGADPDRDQDCARAPAQRHDESPVLGSAQASAASAARLPAARKQDPATAHPATR